MGYKNKYTKKKTRCPRKRRGQSDLQATAQTARAAWKYGKLALSMLNVENKYHDIAISINPSSTVWSTQAFLTIAQGLTSVTRVGDKMKVKKLSMIGAVGIHNSATNSQVKLALVMIPAGGSVAIASEIYDSVSPYSLRDLTYVTKARVLWSKIYFLDDKGPKAQKVEYFKDMDFHVQYEEASTTIEQNDLYLIACSTEAVNVPSLTLNVRVGYIDN